MYKALILICWTMNYEKWWNRFKNNLQQSSKQEQGYEYWQKFDKINFCNPFLNFLIEMEILLNISKGDFSLNVQENWIRR